MNWFADVDAAVAAVPLATLPLRPLLSLARTLVAGYPILYASGLICRVLSDDLNGNIATLAAALADMEREAAAERPPAAPLSSSSRSSSSRPGLGYAPAEGPHFSDLTSFHPASSASPIYAARWVTRVLKFIALLLAKLGADPALSISLAGRQTYKAVIAPHHAPVMSFIVGTVLYWAPTRAWVLKNSLSGASNADACAACLRTAAALAPLAEACAAHLEACGLNHHDVISAVPGGF